MHGASGPAGTELDVVVVGAGLVGLATALAALEREPSLRLAVLEKEASPATHQSGRNSGVVHAGLYYAPGSLKATYCRQGREALLAFADEHSIPYRLTGKLVVATDESELPRLADLAERGRANGLALRELGPDELREVEPNVRGVRALHVPESGVIDYRLVARAYADEIRARGGSIHLGREVRQVGRSGTRTLVRTSGGDVSASLLVGCAGLQSDRLAALTGDAAASYRIVPFRGDYYTFHPRAAELVRGLVYPVPDPAFPFLGVHFTRRVDGSLLAGPNAVPALAREGYGRLSLNVRDLLETWRFPGFRRLARAHARTGAVEIWRDLVKPAFVAQMRRYVPAVDPRALAFGPSGMRAQCLASDGSLVDDFLIVESEGAVHVLNAPSPAATASLVIGRHVADRALVQLAA